MDKFDTNKKAFYKIFQGEDGQWYWHLVAGNGEIICASEGYITKQHAERGQANFAVDVNQAVVKK